MKNNIRNIPHGVRFKLRTLKDHNIVAGCSRQYTADTIQSGALAHLQVEIRENGLHYPERIVPPPTRGKYSSRNVNGYQVVRNDLPIEIHRHMAETPNWGDSCRGTHTVWLPHKAYPRDLRPPRELELILYCPDTNASRASFIIAARVDEVLAQASSDFDERLLADLNLLQENLGACGVEPSCFSLDEYLRTLHLSWDILPPGSRDEAIQRLFQGKPATKSQKELVGARYDFFQSLNPQKIIVGSSGFRRYFGALLEDDLVVFENIQYGNAIYVMYENWETLCQRTRIELLSGRLGEQFDRIVHRNRWKTEVRLIVKAKRRGAGSKEMPIQRPKQSAPRPALWRTSKR